MKYTQSIKYWKYWITLTFNIYIAMILKNCILFVRSHRFSNRKKPDCVHWSTQPELPQKEARISVMYKLHLENQLWRKYLLLNMYPLLFQYMSLECYWSVRHQWDFLMHYFSVLALVLHQDPAYDVLCVYILSCPMKNWYKHVVGILKCH